MWYLKRRKKERKKERKVNKNKGKKRSGFLSLFVFRFFFFSFVSNSKFVGRETTKNKNRKRLYKKIQLQVNKLEILILNRKVEFVNIELNL